MDTGFLTLRRGDNFRTLVGLPSFLYPFFSPKENPLRGPSGKSPLWGRQKVGELKRRRLSQRVVKLDLLMGCHKNKRLILSLLGSFLI